MKHHRTRNVLADRELLPRAANLMASFHSGSQTIVQTPETDMQLDTIDSVPKRNFILMTDLAHPSQTPKICFHCPVQPHDRAGTEIIDHVELGAAAKAFCLASIFAKML